MNRRVTLSSITELAPKSRYTVETAHDQGPFMIHGIQIANPSNWTIHDFRIGNQSQISDGPIPAELFSGITGTLQFPTCQERMPITMDVENVGPEPSVFTAAFIGTTPT